MSVYVVVGKGKTARGSTFFNESLPKTGFVVLYNMIVIFGLFSFKR